MLFVNVASLNSMRWSIGSQCRSETYRVQQKDDRRTCSGGCWHRCYRTDYAYSRCSCRSRRLGGKRRWSTRTLYNTTHTKKQL